MDLLKDDQTGLTESQTQDSHLVPGVFSAHEHEAEIASELLDSISRSTPNTDPGGLKVLTYSDEGSQGFSLDAEANDSSDPESEALPLFPQLSQDFLPTLSTSSDVKAEPSFFLVKDFGEDEEEKPFPAKHPCFMRSLLTQSDTLDSNAIIGAVPDLYIIEEDTHGFILSQTVDPSETACTEYQPLSGAGVEKPEHDCNQHVLVCESAVTQCHSGFSKEQDLENNVSGMSQREELRPPAADAWEVGFMLVSDVRSATDVTIQLQRDDSPVELWLDACQYLMGEDKEGQEVLDTADHPVMQENQESGYNLNDSKRSSCPSDDIRGWGPPVERWSSVDSWASALSDWTGIIEDPSEDIAAAFAEIGAEIDALTQSLDELNSKTELEDDLKATVQEQAQEIMGVQGQPLKTKTIPESSIHSDQSSLSLCPESTGPAGTLYIRSSRTVELCDTTKRDQKPEELPPMGSVSVMVGSPGGVSLSIDSSCDGQLETCDDNVFMNNEDYPIKLKITEDTDLISHPELVYEETFGDGLCQVTDSWRSVNKEGNCEEIKPTAGLSTERLKTPDPGEPDLHTDVSFNTLQDLLGERPVGSPDFIMCLAPLSSESSVVCQANSSLEGQQTQNTSDHVQHYPTSDGITNKPFLECDKELIHKRQKTINTADESSPDGLQEENIEESRFLTDLSGDLVNYPLFPSDYFLAETNRVAFITLDLNDPFTPWAAEPINTPTEPEQLKMPHKTPKNPPESKTRSKKEKSGHHHGAQGKKQETHHVSTQETCKQQENLPPTGENHSSENRGAGPEVKEHKQVIETGTGVTEKGSSKPHGKKKKKHVATVKSEGEPPVDMGSGAKPKSTKGRVDMFEAKLGAKTSKAPSGSTEKKSKQPEDKMPQGENTDHKDRVAKSLTNPPNDDSVKRRRMSGDKFGKIISSLESKLPKTDASIKAKEEEVQGNVGAARKKMYAEVVKEEIPPKKDPEVVQPIQAVSVSGDPQSLSMWCQFTAVHSDYTVTWSREGKVLTEIKRSARDESKVLLTITNASHKDLGKYECLLSCSHGSASLDYLLTYEVLSEIVIPATPKVVSSLSVEVSSEEEDAHYSKLLFKEDFLSDQYFGENLPISIITEKSHFGEGMHRRAFRTKLKEGQVPLLVPGHSCVLKVHNAISYGTKNNDELIQRNFSLAVEECQVQNTAREYIKAYTSAARSVEAFGDVPEIIPIYLVHRPSNDVPYATLEEELIGDFVKYSVKDGKEINLTRRDSEAGQKCCAFQHWVYQNTEGNLLVTDMQGVGMKLTDVGIATCKKGYKGFKGNCATSFIDQFKALHQCNRFCEILGLRSLQPKAKKAPAAPKPKPQPSAAPKKKTFGPTVKGKS